MTVSLRKFCEADIPLKVKWINDPANNRYLHYDLPLQEDGTRNWFHKVQDLDNRTDMTILCDGIPVGIIGLLNIDHKNESAELYITVGETAYKGKGIASAAMKELMRQAFYDLVLHRVYLYTEVENTAAVRAYEKFGFIREGRLRQETKTRNGDFADRFLYSMLKQDFEVLYGKN